MKPNKTKTVSDTIRSKSSSNRGCSSSVSFIRFGSQMLNSRAESVKFSHDWYILCDECWKMVTKVVVVEINYTRFSSSRLLHSGCNLSSVGILLSRSPSTRTRPHINFHVSFENIKSVRLKRKKKKKLMTFINHHKWVRARKKKKKKMMIKHRTNCMKIFVEWRKIIQQSSVRKFLFFLLITTKNAFLNMNQQEA